MPDPRDATMSGALVVWESFFWGDDLLVPPEVEAWLDERYMRSAHGAWHGVRLCSSSGAQLCRDFPELVPENQTCDNARDGFEFLVMHRHMLQSMRESFPRHAEIFDGFPSFPFDAEDVPEVWQDRFGTGWSQSIVETALILENIENELDRFPSEGALGEFIQCSGVDRPVAIHSALHRKWQVAQSPAPLRDTYTNLSNAMFWKLHGWIDDIWERYRVAKGLPADESDLREEKIRQCREMDRLAEIFAP